jgi:pathogenesis-related protein 1
MIQKTVCGLLFLLSIQYSSAQIVPPSTGSNITKGEAQEALDLHNSVRKDVGVAPLQWSNELASFAQLWASKLAADGCKLEHRPANGKWAQLYGENIYYGTAKGLTTLDASKAWYAEIKDFKGDKLTPANFVKVAHYTQMVWRTTTKLGIAKAVCPSGATIIVANYSPLGNYMGQKPY